MSDAYRVIFRGKLLPGIQIDEAKRRCAEQLPLQPAQLEKLFSGKLVTLRKNLSDNDAQKYRQLFNRIGLDVEICPETASAPIPAPAPHATVPEARAYQPDRRPTHAGLPGVGIYEMVSEHGGSRRSGLLKLIIGGILFILIARYFMQNGLGDTNVFRMMFIVIPGVVAIIGLVELTTGQPLSHTADAWDNLRGWQRGVLGLTIIVAVLVLFMIGMALFA